MQFFNIMALAVALAMDAFAVSIAIGISLKTVSPRQTLRLAWHFGFFQAFMPVIGWFLGMKVRSYVESFDHWIAFILLLFVGGKMVFEAFQNDPQEDTPKKDPTKALSLIILSIATSIDALAIGFSFSLLNVSIVFPAFLIGIVAALFTGTGIHLGSKLAVSSKVSVYAEVIGGLFLFGIGLNILHEHGALVL